MEENTKKFLEAYQRMCVVIANDKYKVIKVEKTRKVSYKGNVYVVSKGDYCYDCENLMLARILYMNDMINDMYKKNIVNLKQVKELIEGEING